MVYWRGQQSSSTVDIVYYTYAPWSYAGGAALANLMCTIHTTGTTLVATATPSRDRKRNFRSFIYSHIPANSVKIGPVDGEIIGLTEITKKFLKNISKT